MLKRPRSRCHWFKVIEKFQMPVTVFLRVKPSSHVNLKEILYLEDDQTVHIDNYKHKNIIPINHQIMAMNYKFNKIFYHNSQEEIYQVTASNLIKDALIGINGTILCYGQIGAGKTYTMNGLSQVYNDRGIIPRSIGYLFEEIQKRPTLSITVKLSYIEIYNEQIIDLLAGISLKTTPCKQPSFEFLQIAESNDQVYIKGLNCLTVNNLEEALTILFEGELNRTVASHSLNRFSSRAHAIFTIYLTIIDSMDSNGCIKCGKIHYVDLAGSDNLKGTQITDKLFKEAAYINRSLAFLQQTVLALSDPTRDYIPYRQSKLTHFLKNSIGGRCQTILIANIWNECIFLNETLSTLRFASRAMSIPSKPEVNQMHDPMAIIKKLKNSNASLLRELLMYDTLNNRGQIIYEFLTEKQKNKLRNSVLKYLNNEMKDLEIVNLQQLKETFNIFKQITKSLQVQLDETKGQLSRQSDYTGSRSPTTVAVSTISSSSRSGGTVQGSKVASSNSNISTTKRQTNSSSNNETNLGKSIQNVNFKDKSLVANQVGELDASSGRGFLPPIDRNICDKFSLMTDGAVLQAKRREQKQSIENDKIENIIAYEPMNIEHSNLSSSPNKYEAFEEFKHEPGSELFSIYQQNKNLLQENREKGLKLATEINQIKTNVDNLQIQLKKSKCEREAQGLIQTIEHESIITEDEYNLIKQIQTLKDHYKIKYSEWLKLKEIIQYCKYMLDESQKRLLQEFESWYQQCFMESLNQNDSELHDNQLNSKTLNNSINKNNKVTVCNIKQNTNENDYLMQFKQAQENYFSNRTDLLSYQRAKEMVTYKQVYQRKPQNLKKFHRTLKFGSIIMPNELNNSLFEEQKCNTTDIPA
ncbi:unnamed protein product [Schistosoma rodhaini]|nr:unnamed protein product [Schistosoma rodhaini]